MAQLVEQLIRNQQVAGSSPASSSRLPENKGFRGAFLCFENNLGAFGMEEGVRRAADLMYDLKICINQ